jgi:hypothetical protein
MDGLVDESEAWTMACAGDERRVFQRMRQSGSLVKCDAGRRPGVAGRKDVREAVLVFKYWSGDCLYRSSSDFLARHRNSQLLNGGPVKIQGLPHSATPR